MNTQTGFSLQPARGSSEQQACQKTSTPAPRGSLGSVIASICVLAVWSASFCVQGIAQQATSQSPSENPTTVTEGVSQELLIHKVQPTYPPLARRARIQGTVVLQALIGKDGSIENLELVSGHPMLVGAAIEAVKQWQYKPYYVEGEPVEVETTINVNFMLANAEQSGATGKAGEQAVRPATANQNSASPVGKAAPPRTLGNMEIMEILSDTQGVDFGPYVSKVLEAVRRNWYLLIPQEARAPELKRGRLAIEFVIMPDGKVAGMKLVAPSGDVSLDRAAWGSITASNPFAPLPEEFHGPYLALRFRFFYNPVKTDLEGPPKTEAH